MVRVNTDDTVSGEELSTFGSDDCSSSASWYRYISLLTSVSRSLFNAKITNHVSGKNQLFHREALESIT